MCKMTSASISAVYIFSIISLGYAYLDCVEPYKCILKSECVKRHIPSGGLGGRFLFQCSRRQNYVCCPKTTDQPVLSQRITTTEQFRSTKPLDHPNVGLLPESCGLSPSNNKITFGEDATAGEFPWMALIVFKDLTGKDHYNCGGTLISDRYVLTAAHCFDNPMILSHVRLGEYQLSVERECNDQNQCFTPVDIKVHKPIIHENWDKDLLRNDIALLRLNKNASILNRSDIWPICLPLNVSELKLDNTTILEAAGWGVTDNDDHKNSDRLQKTNLPYNDDECKFCKVPHRFCPLTPGQLCIEGTLTRDVCKGDSGGPLMTTPGIRTFQLGITSNGVAGICGEAGIPSIFTRVSHYLNWILDNMEPKKTSQFRNAPDISV